MKKQKAVCFGEIMGRLNPDGYLRIKQAKSYNLSFAGGEVNVAVALASFGLDAAFVTKAPANDLTEAMLRDVRGYKVDVSHIVYGGDRLGMYYVEKGASQRPSKVIYDRKYSAISMADPADFDWDKILDGATWFHFTGITPALSQNTVEITRQALAAAKKKGITTSCDINYRATLWTPQEAGRVMTDLMEHVDICISNEEDAEQVFGIHAKGTDVSGGRINKEGYEEVARRLMDKFAFKKVAITMRGSISASDNSWAAMLYDGKNFFHSKNYVIHLVDRVGGGDSFAGALIYGLMSGHEDRAALDFAVAASCLKQATEYDFVQSSVAEVNKLIGGDASGRVQR